jgi:hypothetical protein
MPTRRKATEAAPTPESEPASGAVPAWLQLVVAAALTLVGLVFIAVLTLLGKPIPDALLSTTSIFGGGTLTLIRTPFRSS